MIERLNGNVNLAVGDCLDVMRGMPDGSVHCCVTSPPYWGLRDYGNDAQIGLEDTPQRYIERMVDVFREVRRVLRDDGTLWLNLGDSYTNGGRGGGRQESCKQKKNVGSLNSKLRGFTEAFDLPPKNLLGMPWRVAFALQDDGWMLRSELTWIKSNAMPESVTDRPSCATEKVFLLSKSSRYYYDHMAVRLPPNESTLRKLGGSARGRRTGRDKQAGHGKTYAGFNERWNEKRKGNHHTPPGKGEHMGFVEKWDSMTAEEQAENGANMRNWIMSATGGYTGAHFAAFPPALVRPFILAGTSERGVCPQCGAQHVRIVRHVKGEVKPCPKMEAMHVERGDKGDPGMMGGTTTRLPASVTEGWSPGCGCDAGAPVPATVLDPFAGSGTTGEVASELGRRALLVELNPDYGDLIRNRPSLRQETLL